MNANERRRTHTHERRRKGTDADVWARTQTYIHERTRMGMDADVHARTRTDADVLWDLSERIMGFKRTVCGGRARKKHAVRGGLNSN